MNRAGRIALLGLWLGLGFAGVASSHPLAPSLLDLRVRDGGRADVLFKTPAVRPSGVVIEPVLPSECRSVAQEPPREEGTAVLFEIGLECGSEGIVGRRVGVRGLEASGTNALLRIELPDGALVRAVLHGGRSTLVVPASKSALQTAREYLVLGIEHILGGIDHLMFVAGLLLLVDGLRRLVVTITAFTVGHSVTLSAAALGWVRVPSGPIEVAIAASILWLAVEIGLRRGEKPPKGFAREPRGMAGVFGLLHGFGFAGALSEVGLPANEIPLALASFNVGIELGQIAFVAVLASGAALARRRWMRGGVAWTNAAAHVLGSLASLWMLERIAALL